MRYKLLFLFSIIFSIITLADDIVINRYISPKTMSMGGTKMMNSLDESSLIYNPALLSFIHENQISFPLNFSFGLNDEGFDNAEALSDFFDDLDKTSTEIDTVNLLNSYLKGSEMTTTTETGETITLNTNKHNINNKFLQLKTAPLNWHWVAPGKGIAFIIDGNIKKMGLVDNPGSPLFIGNMEWSLEIPLGVSFDINDTISLGASISYLNSVKINTRLDANALLNLKESKIEEIGQGINAKGFSTSFGGIYRLENLNIGVSLKDPLSYISLSKFKEKIEIDETTGESTTKYKLEDAGSANLPTNLSLGITNNQDLESEFLFKRIGWSVEIENILNKDLDEDGFSDDNFYKKLHAGIEIPIFKNLRLRSGLNQGYFTWGAYARVFFLDFEYSDYTEELGPHIGMDSNHIRAFSVSTKF
ncbi:MAG: Outer membrane protein transport protein (OMPP1/FadL/TodX) [bacterium ADurb.Bin363]|nr:MAG: Outer membrane protein transport protein (OMPP1/FadL/TodX) [bacterium ADurb.Bin363]